MILRFSTIDLNGNPKGIAFNTNNKKYSYEYNFWKQGSIPISPINLARIDRTLIKDGFYPTIDANDFIETESEESK